jgi:NAD(P)-dependent dehydrogenase (short-subunit alcohol dehydrogenase family)
MGISDFYLSEKVAVVVGARRGLGKDIAMTFADAKASVAVCDVIVDDGQLASVSDEIHKIGRPSLALQVDSTRKTDVDNMVQKVVDKFGKIDILVNCAAIITKRTPLYECEEEDWQRVMDVNLKGYVLCCQAVSKKMIEQKKGNIINISGLGGIKPLRDTGAYPLTKAGVIMLSKQLGWELAKYNIRVNDICPWFVATPISEVPRSQREKDILSGIPLGRMGEARDISNAALFLASDASSWITGQTLIVDGGHLIFDVTN